MGLLAANGEVEGSAIFEGKELVNLPNAELNKIRAECAVDSVCSRLFNLSNT